MENVVNEDKEHILNFAQMFLESGDLDNALIQFKKALVMNPDDVDTHQSMGDTYAKNNHTQLAYEAYNKAVSLLLSNGQIDKALSIFKKIGTLDPSKLPT